MLFQKKKIKINVKILFFGFPSLVMSTIVKIVNPSIKDIIVDGLLKTWFEKYDKILIDILIQPIKKTGNQTRLWEISSFIIL